MTDKPPPVSLDDPRVQARVDQKAHAHQDAIAAQESAALAVEQHVGPWTFYPPNSCTMDAICQPAIMSLSQIRMRFILGYLLTVEPARQIPASADVTALRQAAAQWQDSIPAEHLPAVIRIINSAWNWMQESLTRDSVFFSTT